MPNVVSAIDGTSHEIQIPSNEPQQETYFQQTNSFLEVRCLTPLSKIFQLLLLWWKLEYPEKSTDLSQVTVINSDNHKFHQYQ
jgi:hypothetical protein